MSERQEHKKRYNRRLEYIAAFEKWESHEPKLLVNKILFRLLPSLRRWRRWLAERPRWED
ncbi:MAG: hypothetical protein J5482_02830 [Oscillospiraceae bacterium]|nr:hypothetical protein [Oscillospiraceae bacterium]